MSSGDLQTSLLPRFDYDLAQALKRSVNLIQRDLAEARADVRGRFAALRWRFERYSREGKDEGGFGFVADQVKGVAFRRGGSGRQLELGPQEHAGGGAHPGGDRRARGEDSLGGRFVLFQTVLLKQQARLRVSERVGEMADGRRV